MRTAILLTGLLVAALPADDPVIARAGDTVFHRAEFGDWLVARYGDRYVDEFVGDQLVLGEAARRGMLPDAEQLETAWKTELGLLIRNGYSDHMDAFERDLKTQNSDVETYKRHRQHAMLVELAETNMIRADRTISENDLRNRYTAEYGVDGENIRLGVLFFSSFQKARAEPSGDDAVAEFEALREAARARANAARTALLAGKTLAEVLPDSDRPASDEVVDGVVAHYRKRMFGNDVDNAVASLDNAGDISPEIRAFDGSYVVQLIERRKVRFEDARPELERLLRDAPPNSEEYGNAREAIVTARQPEVLIR